jgi:TonB-dependent receptor
MRTQFTLTLILSFIFSFSFAQKGELSGIVKDAEFNDVLPFANIIVKDLNSGTTSDFDGIYTITLNPGTYTIVFKFLGYTTTEVTGIIIKADDVTNLDISLQPASANLEEIVISAKIARNTESSVLNMQKKSINLMDGLSAQNFKKMGAGNLASAVKSVPGVSIQGGKYVYVRGLGDRYTKTILNGVDIPGLDPDRNTIQMDIFPTNILDNIQVIKSATADLPADFTGGIVNIVTKEFPTRKENSISLSGAYNSKMHFNDNYLDYAGGGSDFLGYDDGARALPISPYQPIPNTFNNKPLLTALTKSFSQNLAAKKSTSGMDYSFGYTTGYQFNIGKNKLGLIGSFSYKNDTKFYENSENSFYRKDPNVSITELPLSRSQKGGLGENNVIISGLAGISFKTKHSKYKVNVMHIQNGESSAGLFTQVLNESDFITFKKDNLAYTQRAITNTLISGTHTNEDASWKTEWKLSPTYSTIYDKDIRTTAFQVLDDGGFSIAPNNEPKRIWRNLEEVNYVGKIDFTRKYDFKKRDAKLKFGAYGSYKERAYSIYTFQIGLSGSTSIFNGDADAILADENLWTVDKGQGSFIRNISVADPANIFEANQINLAGYVSNEFKIGEKLKTILGLRVEQFQLNYTGQNTTATLVLDNASIIDALDFFPSVNLIYGLTDNKNIRFSYSKTTARPSFKEASIAEIFDPLSNVTYIGNINLKPTYINNLDMRFEFYGEKAQMFAISGFYKSFTNPIELTYFQSALDNFTPNNLGSANVYGVEIELRKNLGFLSSRLENLKFNINASVIKSELKMGVDELTLRQNTARTGENVSDTRDLQGQSPYLVNAGFDYDNDNLGLQTGLFYNVQGKTLEVVGGANPDVFTMPFNSLNFTFNKSIGKDKKANINFKITNLLGEEKESFYQSFKALDQVFSRRDPGTSFTIGYSVKF